MTATFVAISAFRVPKILSPTWKLVKWLAVDAAEYLSPFGVRYRIGFFDGVYGQVFECPSWVCNQQVAELYGVLVLVRISARRRYSQVTMLQDNMQAIWNTINLRSRAGLWRQNRILRAVTHQLRRSALVVHVVYTPTELQPANPLSRVQVVDSACIDSAVQVARDIWGSMLNSLKRLQVKGVAFVPT